MNSRIQHVLERKGATVESAPPRMSVLTAVERMNELKIGALVVIDEQERGRLLGILTERDILARVVATGRAPDATSIDEVMTRALVVVSAQATVDEAMILMTDHRLRHLPVVDGDRVCGLISIGDLTSWLVRDQQRTIDDLHDYICHT
ncbi:MAG: CBS domain-containing protein [Proteobacteria bacterium]|nr:CBS domain-containing protein [Pseudomonadota bacterium]